MSHKRNTKGLLPFKSGYDPRRNITGRAQVNDIKGYIKGRLTEDADADGRYSKLDSLIEAVIKRAMRGDHAALKLCLEYGFGKPTQTIEVSGKDGAAILTHDFSNISNDELQNHIATLKETVQATSGEAPPTAESGTV